MAIPKTMRALQLVSTLSDLPYVADTLTISYRYSKPEHYGLVEVPVPELRENDILVGLQYTLWKLVADRGDILDQGQGLRCLRH